MAGSHFTGPILHQDHGSGPREWFSKMPVLGDPDYVVYFNDFLVDQDYQATDWVVTEVGVATQAIAANELNGALLITNAAADNDSSEQQSTEQFVVFTENKRLWFETKLKVSDATQSDLFVGFATTDTTVIAGTTDSIGFRKDDGDANIDVVTEDATVETLTDTTSDLANDTYVTLGFFWNGLNAVEFYVNRVRKATHTATIEQTNSLALTFAIQNGEAVAKTMTIDYLYICMER